MQKEQRVWNVAALLAFVVMCGFSAILVSRYGAVDPASISFFDLTLLGLATFRLVHLLTYDKMFDIVRDPFKDGRGARLKKAARGWRRLMCELLECIWCTGMWSALIAVTVFLVGSWGLYVVFVLAVAGLGSLFQVVSKAIAASTA